MAGKASDVNPRVTDIIKQAAEVMWEIQRKAEEVKSNGRTEPKKDH